MLFLLLYGLSADEPNAPQMSLPSFLADNRKFAAVTAVLAISAFVAIHHQSRRWADAREWQAHDRSRQTEVAGTDQPPAMPPPPPSDVATTAEPPIVVPPAPSPTEAPTASPVPSLTPVPSATPLQRIGPFAVGAAITPGWSVDSFTLSDGGFIATLSGKPGRARFEVTCAPSPHLSPFDLGNAHIFYSNDFAFRDLQAAGLAMREAIRKAAHGDDVCADIARWRAAVQPEQPPTQQPEREP